MMEYKEATYTYNGLIDQTNQRLKHLLASLHIRYYILHNNNSHTSVRRTRSAYSLYSNIKLLTSGRLPLSTMLTTFSTKVYVSRKRSYHLPYSSSLSCFWYCSKCTCYLSFHITIPYLSFISASDFSHVSQRTWQHGTRTTMFSPLAEPM